jgi:two-component system OmpR family response regulator
LAKVLVIEDDPAVAEAVSELLRSQGHRVEVVYDGQEGYDHLILSGYDLAIVDWQLPSLNGTVICARYRANNGKVPILMLTQKSSTTDKATGLDAGADDYLPKPFDAKEFNARVRALLRRSSGFFQSTKELGKLVLDSGACTVCIDERTIKLLPSEFALVEFLMRHPGTFFTADQLLKHVWDSSAEVTSEALRTCVSRLRTKLDQPGEPSIIETSRGWGYKISERIFEDSK